MSTFHLILASIYSLNRLTYSNHLKNFLYKSHSQWEGLIAFFKSSFPNINLLILNLIRNYIHLLNSYPLFYFLTLFSYFISKENLIATQVVLIFHQDINFIDYLNFTQQHPNIVINVMINADHVKVVSLYS